MQYSVCLGAVRGKVYSKTGGRCFTSGIWSAVANEVLDKFTSSKFYNRLEENDNPFQRRRKQSNGSWRSLLG